MILKIVEEGGGSDLESLVGIYPTDKQRATLIEFYNQEIASVTAEWKTLGEKVAKAKYMQILKELRVAECKDKISTCIDVLVDMWYDYGFDKAKSPRQEAAILQTVRRAREHWLCLALELKGDWMKVVKYKLAAFFASNVKDQMIPPAPFKTVDRPNIMLGGQFYRYYRTMRVKDIPNWWSFMTTGLQSKKGMVRPDDIYLLEGKDKLVKELTTKPEPKKVVSFGVSWGQQPLVWNPVNFDLRPETLKEELERTVDELLPIGEVDLTQAERNKLYWPSTKANAEFSQRNGGGVAAVLKAIHNNPRLRTLRKPGGYLTQVDGEVDSTALETAGAVLNEELVKMALAEPRKAKPVMLPESLKVRGILKGPALTNHILRGIWKHIHNILRNHPTFLLLGRTVTEELILNALGANLGDDELFLSGDYAAATDKLLSLVSETIGRRVARNLRLTEDETELLIRNLIDHVIEGKQQERGQSMGSITSFVILCIANSALVRWAMEVSEKRRMTLERSPMLINGDDIAARGKKDLYKIWSIITAYGGLEESVGKTYWSREFVQINSTNFIYDKDSKHSLQIQGEQKIVQRLCPYTRVRFINYGLIKGLKRSSTERSAENDEEITASNIGARARELVRMAPDWARPVVMNRFIATHKNLLDICRVPWYIPELYGGLGLPSYQYVKDGKIKLCEPSDKDLRIANYIRTHWGERLFPKDEKSHIRWIPQFGGLLTAVWETRNLAKDRLPEAIMVAPGTKMAENYDKLLNLSMINLIFDSDIQLDDLLNDTTLTENKKALKHNARLWKEGLNHVSKSRPADMEMLTSIPRTAGTLLRKTGGLVITVEKPGLFYTRASEGMLDKLSEVYQAAAVARLSDREDVIEKLTFSRQDHLEEIRDEFLFYNRTGVDITSQLLTRRLRKAQLSVEELDDPLFSFDLLDSAPVYERPVLVIPRHKGDLERAFGTHTVHEGVKVSNQKSTKPNILGSRTLRKGTVEAKKAVIEEEEKNPLLALNRS